MKRRNLCRTKRVLAIIIAASMSMSTVSTAMANPERVSISVTEDIEVDDAEDESEFSGDVVGSITVEASYDENEEEPEDLAATGSGDYKVEGNVTATATEGGTATVSLGDGEVSIDGNVTANASTEGPLIENNSNAEIHRSDEDDEDEGQGEVGSISIGGYVSATAKDGGANINLHDASVSSKSDESITAVNAESENLNSDSNAEVTIGNVSATSNNSATGVSASATSNSDEGYSVSASVDAGSVNATSKTDQAIGINASSGGEGATTNVTAAGVTAHSDSESHSDTPTIGINASSKNGGSTTVDIVNADEERMDVTASSVGGRVHGIDAISEDGETTVNVGNVTVSSQEGPNSGVVGVFATSEGEDGKTEVSVDGKLSSTSNEGYAYGVNVGAEGGQAEVTVSDGITASGKTGAAGVSITDSPYMGKGEINVTTGGVEAKSTDGTAKAIDLGENRTSLTTTIVVDGDVKATSDSSFASGISGSVGEGSIATITVDGDVIAKGLKSEGINIDGSAGEVGIEVNGSVVQDGETGFAVGISDSNNEYDVVATENTDISVTVKEVVPDPDEKTGKVIAADTAVQIYKAADESKVNLFVEDEISGGNHNVVLMGESKTENLNITVWKVDTTNDKNVVENKVWNESEEKYEYTENAEVEKQINYIIKADPAITLSGNDNIINGYYTEHQAGKVFLKVDIPEGCTAKFRDINGNNNYQIVPDGNGGAYLIVPRGGGVEVGVEIIKNNNPTPGSDVINDNNPTPGSDVINDNNPTPGSNVINDNNPTPGSVVINDNNPTPGSNVINDNVPTPGGESTNNNESIPVGEIVTEKEINNNTEVQNTSEPSSNGAPIRVNRVIPSGGGSSDGSSSSGGSSSGGSSGGSFSSGSSDFVNNNSGRDYGGIPAATENVMGLQVHAMNYTGSDMVQFVTDVLKPVDALTAINNFSAAGTSTNATGSIQGAGIVSFNNMFINSVTDTVEVPVTANVSMGQTYTVVFSDGTSIQLPCVMNGILNIPFNKNAEGLTYIIYGLDMNPAMFIGTATANLAN